MKLDILAIAAHPDDIELGCSGVLMMEKIQGKKVGVIDLTRGELGTRGTSGTARTGSCEGCGHPSAGYQGKSWAWPTDFLRMMKPINDC